jgi:hypothetical protein
LKSPGFTGRYRPLPHLLCLPRRYDSFLSYLSSRSLYRRFWDYPRHSGDETIISSRSRLFRSRPRSHARRHRSHKQPTPLDHGFSPMVNLTFIAFSCLFTDRYHCFLSIVTSFILLALCHVVPSFRSRIIANQIFISHNSSPY